jgi:adenosylcobyric acid synthase
LQDYHAVILPGSKNTTASLRHLQQTGLATELARAAQSGKPIVGVCGGMQMLGRSIADPYQLESGDMAGLGLLDLATTLALDKVTRQRQVRWGAGGGMVQGYEIHHGQTQAGARVRPHLAEDLGWQQENITGVYLHGLFENTAYRQHFLMQLGWQGHAEDWRAQVERELDRVAELVETSGWSSVFPKLGQDKPSVFQALET